MKTTRDRVFDVVEGILLLFCREMSAEYNAAFARVARLFREAKEAQAATDLGVVDSVRARLDTLAITFAVQGAGGWRSLAYQLARLARFACEVDTAAYLPLILTSARRMREDFGIADPTEPVTPEQLRAFEDRWHPTPKPLLTVTQANLRNAGSEVEDPAWLSKQFGVDMGKIDPGAAPFTGEFGDARKEG